MFDSLPGTSQLVSAVFCVSFSGRVNVIESICEPVPRDWSGKNHQVFDMPKVTGWAGYSVNQCSRLILIRLGHRYTSLQGDVSTTTNTSSLFERC